MHMKYRQSLADIRKHYDDILFHFDNPTWGHYFFKHWGIDVTEIELIKEEREALRYLIGCRLMLVEDSDAKKPSIEIVNRCFHRHLAYLEKVHQCHAYNVNKHASKTIQKEYKACRHYLFKFSLPAWYHKLPDRIQIF